MSWLSRNWKKLVKNLAPALGTALGGPGAGYAVGALGKALLGKEDASEQEVADFIMQNQNPEVLAQIKQAELDFQFKLEELGIRMEELAVADRRSARKLGGKIIWPQIVLSGLFVLGYFAVLGLVLHFMLGAGSIEPEYLSILSILLGVLTSELPRILAFWFGSSHGSKEKDAKLKGADE